MSASDIRRAMKWVEGLPSVDEGPWCAHATEILVWIQRADAAMRAVIEDGELDTDDHCDCPICEMMASDMLGPSIAHFDAHALEVDDEFAFSTHATRETWEAQQRECK